ncbi:TetR/AcrR family transcriptional regulator [Rossellomorea aquimaris]|uniref:TetR/AcrR family transcriptional regulator n=1 Tax=Rossellomorea aquimaris TaxID=189382 RepID=UPI001CD51A03|nr:TetR/AcrR family transcriptional regulator [Rossellomorea aquimaris]MCA1060523.1 TetR/AcrR family transcriptional regulator [Rossellomorea aquimaris]
MDRRIIKTKKSIKDALLTVSAVKGVGAVTVQDIINEANINRATFYYHYKDKVDLLQVIIEETLEGLAQELVVPVHVDSFADVVYPPIRSTFEHVKKYIEVYQITLSKKGIPEFRWEMLSIIKESVRDNIDQFKKNKHDITVDSEFLVSYISGALVTLIIDWVERDLPESAELMAGQMARVLTDGVYKK